MPAASRLTLAALGVAGAGLAYAGLVERQWFHLRECTVPVLPPGARPLRVLHISDAHLTPGQHRKIDWIRALAEWRPDLVVNTGDSIAHEDAVPAFLEAVAPLLDVPGVFVRGSNDHYAPQLRNPLRYLLPGRREVVPDRPATLPWRELVDKLTAAGWVGMDNRRTRLKVAGLDIEVAGVADAHIHWDRYEEVAGPVDPGADVHLGVMHSPEPAVMDRFVADGFDVLFAGHTHGGQLCVPGYGALVTNCGLDRARVKGLSRHGEAWLHVSAGLGTSPAAPVRFACPPEASAVTLVPRAGS